MQKENQALDFLSGSQSETQCGFHQNQPGKLVSNHEIQPDAQGMLTDNPKRNILNNTKHCFMT